ncbi:MAG: hypothetical protein ABI691_21020 [Ginsengibacter sp.]
MLSSGKFTLKQYHDAVLQQNSMPVEMLRKILANEPIDKDYIPHWRFYELP